MEKISIPDELIVQAQKYIEAGRFKNFNDFFVQAIKLLLYAEDNKKHFEKILKK